MMSTISATRPNGPINTFQALIPVASSEKTNVGQSAEGNEALEAQMEDGRVVRGRAVQRGNP